MIDTKKDIRLQIRINEATKDLFDKYCKEQGSTMSDEIKRYITKCIKDNK